MSVIYLYTALAALSREGAGGPFPTLADALLVTKGWLCVFPYTVWRPLCGLALYTCTLLITYREIRTAGPLCTVITERRASDATRSVAPLALEAMA